MDTQENTLCIVNAQVCAKTMTLKEITDLLNVRHDKAMIKVAEMAKSPEFGSVSIVDIQYSSGKGRIDTIKTYQLDKRQSMAVSSKLNTPLLMRIIDRWQELEAGQQAPAPRELSRMDLIKLAMEAEQERLLLAAKVEEMEPTVAAYDRLTNAENTVTMTDAAKQLKLKPSQLREWMVTHKWIYKLGGAKAWTAHQDRIDSGYMMHKTITVERDGETSIYSQARVTAKGLATISKAIEKARKTAMIVGAAA